MFNFTDCETLFMEKAAIHTCVTWNKQQETSGIICFGVTIITLAFLCLLTGLKTIIYIPCLQVLLW